MGLSMGLLMGLLTCERFFMGGSKKGVRRKITKNQKKQVSSCIWDFVMDVKGMIVIVAVVDVEGIRMWSR